MDMNPLDLSGAELRRLVEATLARLGPHLDSLSSQPASHLAGAELAAKAIREPLPVQGRSWESLLNLLFDHWIPKSINAAGPGYLGFIPGGGLPEAAIAQFVAASVNRYVGIWAAAPCLAALEAAVVSWFAGIVGYPETTRGYLTSGGSLANFGAVFVARRERLGSDLSKGAIYASDQTHHSMRQAAILAGFPEENLRRIETDERFRIRVDRLREAVLRDRAARLIPLLVVGNAGTTATGAVDDLAALADLAAEEGLWLHIDAAYGGFFALTERGRDRLAGIERSDSVTLDPHKGLFLPFGTGSLLVRDGAALRRAHAAQAVYLPDMPDDPDRVDFGAISPELSRPFRGLGVWLPVAHHGIGPFRDLLDEKLDLARFATEGLRRIPSIEIVAEPELSIVAFRYVRPDLPPEALDSCNRDLLKRVNSRERVFLSGTTLRGRFTLRIAVLSFRTHRDRIETCLEDLREAAAEIDHRLQTSRVQ